MDVTFSTAALAALCSSERRLAQRWGPSLGRTVARRLLDLSAADAATLGRLPRARVSTNGTGGTIITFGDDIVVRGIINSATVSTPASRGDADSIVITSLDVHGSDER